MWVRFTSEFRWEPSLRWSIHYHEGSTHFLKRETYEAAKAAGKIVRLRRISKEKFEEVDDA